METWLADCELIPYPRFGDVFEGTDLLGIFYPLCTVVHPQFGPLHFVSSNGLWMDEAFATDQNDHSFTVFEVSGGKYRFGGDTRLYKGGNHARRLFPILEKDFAASATSYLEHESTDSYDYINGISDLFPESMDFDLDYYLATFFAFSVNRMQYESTGTFRADLGGCAFIDPPDDGYAAEHLHPKGSMIQHCVPLGLAVGSLFFQDGNDEALYYNPENNQALIVNCYG